MAAGSALAEAHHTRSCRVLKRRGGANPTEIVGAHSHAHDALLVIERFAPDERGRHKCRARWRPVSERTHHTVVVDDVTRGEMHDSPSENRTERRRRRINLEIGAELEPETGSALAQVELIQGNPDGLLWINAEVFDAAAQLAADSGAASSVLSSEDLMTQAILEAATA